MGDPQNQNMVKPCEICGAIGWDIALLICFKCRVTREHIYCMKVPYDGDPKIWICDDCSSNKIPSSKLGMRFMIKQPPRNSKVQYITPEEAMVLESGAIRNNASSPSKSNFARRSSVNKSVVSKKEAYPSSSLPSKYNGKLNPSVGPSGCKEPLNKWSLPSCLKEKKSSAFTEKENNVIQKEHAWEKSPVAKQSAKSMQKSNAVMQKETGIDTPTKAQPKNVDSMGSESPRVKMVFDSYLPNHPAVTPTWRGTFKIFNDVLPCGFFDGIQAHPPCKVHSKVYKLSKQLPKTLQFELLPRQNFWVDFFEGDVPGELDIGLYFLPSKTSNCSLLEHLDRHDLLLRSCIGKVELFVFSSKHLEEKSRKINQMHFLWGLFCPSEGVQHRHSEEHKAAEMDVDMLGGLELDNIDVIVPTPNDKGCQDHGESEIKPSNKTKASPRSPAGAVLKFSPSKVKKECSDGGEASSEYSSCLQDELEFEKELQKSFDNFTALMQLKEARCLKREVKVELDA